MRSVATISLALPNLGLLEVLAFDSEDQNLWCDHSNEISLAVLSHITCYCEVYIKAGYNSPLSL